MTLDEARALMRYSDDDEIPTVTIRRSFGEWTGIVVGVVESPALVLRCADGQKRVIVLDGATVTDG